MGLMDHLATIDDPRDPRGRHYRLPTLLTLCVCALTSTGHDTTCAIIEWAHNAPRHVLLALGLPVCPFTQQVHLPDEHTLRDLLTRVGPAQPTRAGLDCLNTHTGHPATPAYATDGKTQRGARARKGQSSASVVFHSAPHHDAAVVASAQISSTCRVL